MVRVRSGVVSITGDYRENNEDKAHVDPDGRFFLVADGMGGQAAGEKASFLAIDLVSRKLTQSLRFNGEPSERVIDAVDRAVEHANSEIIALGQIDPAYNQMGTTIVLLVINGEEFFIGGVGDSRVYQLRGETFTQLTTDHSLTQALRDAGTISEEEAKNHRYKNVLYRYLGTKDGGKGAETQIIAPAAGDRYLLCSDGVTDGCDPETLARLLTESDDPQQTAETVVAEAQRGGSRDNITCLVLFAE